MRHDAEKRPRRYRYVRVLRRDRDGGASRPRRDRDIQKTPQDRVGTETFETETTTLLCSIMFIFVEA